MYSTKAIIL